MSDKGDKLCPLCTEEMDLTDQQLKPCKCGYEICVWCWNHIMEMAEKDNTEGRCPACRSFYDKERIVGMAANCERLVAEINSERKLKSTKVKAKLSEGRMHLTNVRVIQRNLVYLIGLPLNLADEAVLQQREYFGQYGKVLKVSISKTATGVIQHSSNKSCCVYITYSKEEEAVRCIQSVHSFVLEGRTLRACFGTTKYCHAWLKNMPCSIPDCLYLHEFGTQEDSFTKDDLVSAFTRSKVQQIIGATNNLHRRSGNVLPPPADEYTDGNIISTAKLNSKSSLNKIGNCDSGPCADSGTETSDTFPGTASWVMSVSSGAALATNLLGSGSSDFYGTLNHNPDTSSGTQVFASEVLSTKKSSDAKKTMISEGSCELHPILVTSRNVAMPPVGVSSLGLNKPSCFLDEDGDFQGVCSAISSIRIDSHLKNENSNPVISGSSIYNHNLPVSQGSQQDVSLPVKSSALPALRENLIVKDLFGDQHLKGSGDVNNVPSTSCLLPPQQNLKESGFNSLKQGQISYESNFNAYPSTAPIECEADVVPLRAVQPGKSSEFCDNQPSSGLQMDGTSNYSVVFSDTGLGKCLEGGNNSEGSPNNKVAPDVGENNIISSILAMDFDAWEDTLTSPQSLVKLLAKTDRQHSSLRIPNLRKVQDGNQSRFSFARQDDFFDQDSKLGHTVPDAINCSTLQHYNENKDVCMDRHYDISSNGGSVDSNSFLSSNPFLASKFSVAKAPASPPPGFTLPSRAVPPGFPTNGAVNYDASCLRQNPSPLPGNAGISVDVEFMDPAITEAGKGTQAVRLNNPGFGMRPALSPHLGTFDHDMELQMVMQQPVSVKQNPRFLDHFRNRFSPPDNAYNISSMLLGQSPPNSPSPFAQVSTQQVRNWQMSHGCWGGWDEIKSGNLGMSELLMNGRLGFNKIFPSHEDLKYQMSSSNNLYNRGFA
ncbi:uncharacterized protein LOC110622649 isoform X2 [Manihot esculenta]|nr:uncharacterized protein LOC110622649 isoform X2 [Manihot esculenta]KAG8647320.1 hypothetical protein MANES_09G080400v8 [Manihot esculenta]KAG8647322.1 hypothetical protein MANES_09G080400v8 [Manihot esculenta]KAG8647324.1 hypothetical protein MANES_09G080400v8 [Manihot esculenta]KAG8647325.1 hypothetical protein MANES_09G080400v8 [Manihot esculenta]OAY41177.1 hypothetical protein MANES_09G080400v8 [Manihot esculenta]